MPPTFPPRDFFKVFERPDGSVVHCLFGRFTRLCGFTCRQETTTGESTAGDFLMFSPLVGDARERFAISSLLWGTWRETPRIPAPAAQHTAAGCIDDFGLRARPLVPRTPPHRARTSPPKKAGQRGMAGFKREYPPRLAYRLITLRSLAAHENGRKTLTSGS